MTHGSKELEDFVLEFKNGLRQVSPALVLDWIGKAAHVSIPNLHQHDLNNVKSCDLMIAFVDEPSMGLGMEIQAALDLKQEVLCLYREGRAISRLLQSAADNGLVPLRSYKDLDDAIRIAADFIAASGGKRLRTAVESREV